MYASRTLQYADSGVGVGDGTAMHVCWCALCACVQAASPTPSPTAPRSTPGAWRRAGCSVQQRHQDTRHSPAAPCTQTRAPCASACRR